MITIFTSPKPFLDESYWNQVNALRSWRLIHPEVEIFVFGNVEGAAEAAKDVNAFLVEDFEVSSTGAPSFNSMVDYVNKNSKYNLHVYSNADMLFDKSLFSAINSASEKFEDFLLIGERVDLSKGVLLDANEPEFPSKIKGFSEDQIKAHGPSGADFFGFKKGLWKNLDQVYMGRAMCDHVLIHYCLKLGIPVIDSTLKIRAIHQYHDYKHLKGGRKTVMQGIDTQTMSKLHKLYHSVPMVSDADWRFNNDHVIVKDQGRRHFLRKWELFFRYKYKVLFLSIIARALQRILHKLVDSPKLYKTKELINSWFK